MSQLSETRPYSYIRYVGVQLEWYSPQYNPRFCSSAPVKSSAGGPYSSYVSELKFKRQLKLIVDSASPLTSKTWLDSRLQSTTKMLGAFEGQPINPLGYFEAIGVRQDDSTKSAVIKIYVSQNSINILGHDAQTKLSVSIDPTKFGSFSSTAFSTQKPPGCTQCECRTFQFCSGTLCYYER